MGAFFARLHLAAQNIWSFGRTVLKAIKKGVGIIFGGLLVALVWIAKCVISMGVHGALFSILVLPVAWVALFFSPEITVDKMLMVFIGYDILLGVVLVVILKKGYLKMGTILATLVMATILYKIYTMYLG